MSKKCVKDLEEVEWRQLEDLDDPWKGPLRAVGEQHHLQAAGQQRAVEDILLQQCLEGTHKSIYILQYFGLSLYNICVFINMYIHLDVSVYILIIYVHTYLYRHESFTYIDIYYLYLFNLAAHSSLSLKKK